MRNWMMKTCKAPRQLCMCTVVSHCSIHPPMAHLSYDKPQLGQEGTMKALLAAALTAESSAKKREASKAARLKQQLERAALLHAGFDTRRIVHKE